MNAIALNAPAQTRRIIRAGAITVAAALVTNLAIDALAHAIFDVPHRFTPLQPGSVAFLTILGVIAATAAYRVVSSRVSDPSRTFHRVVLVVLVPTFIPDVLIWVLGAYHNAATAKTVLPLMVMHIAAAAACGILLPRLATQAQRTSRTAGRQVQ